MGFLKASAYVVLLAIGIYLMKQYMNGAVCESTERLDGKVVIVTGANTGIGKETAQDLVKRGAKVYMACRSLERTQPAVADIIRATGVDASQLPIMHLDLGSLQSIRDFAEEFKQKEKRLDILINNAGQMWVPESRTFDGFETTFGVNHLGPFLLTHLLVDLMIAGNSPSRIINVSSRAHTRGTINFDDLMMEKNYNSMSSYSQSKLANVLFTTELARRLTGTHITAYSLHPGTIRTELIRHIWFISDTVIGQTLFYYLSWPFLKEPWNGAQTTICCAVDKHLATQSGKYYSECAETEPITEAMDDSVAKRLWNVSLDLVRLSADEIHPQLRHRHGDQPLNMKSPSVVPL